MNAAGWFDRQEARPARSRPCRIAQPPGAAGGDRAEDAERERSVDLGGVGPEEAGEYAPLAAGGPVLEQDLEAHASGRPARGGCPPRPGRPAGRPGPGTDAGPTPRDGPGPRRGDRQPPRRTVPGAPSRWLIETQGPSRSAACGDRPAHRVGRGIAPEQAAGVMPRPGSRPWRCNAPRVVRWLVPGKISL